MVTDPNYSGNYSISGCAGIVGHSATSSSPLTLTAQAAGTCTLTVSDGSGDQATISVTVSTLSVPVD